jgi:ribosomal protein L37E
MHLRRAFLWTMIISLSLAAVIGIVALLLPTLGPADEILISTALFAAFSLVAMCCAIVIEQGRLQLLMWLGIIASGAALLTWLFLVWFERSLAYRSEEYTARTAGAFNVICVWCAYFGLLTVLPLRHPWAKTVQWTAIAATSIVGLFIFMACLAAEWMEDRIIDVLGEDLAFRLLGAVGIVAACGTVLAPILWKIQALRQATSGESIPSRLRVQVVCPRCGTAQALAVGPSQCAQCGLRITLKVEEPRCACGYLLYRLEGEQCPECGRPIPPNMRWMDAPADAGGGTTAREGD